MNLIQITKRKNELGLITKESITQFFRKRGRSTSCIHDLAQELNPRPSTSVLASKTMARISSYLTWMLVNGKVVHMKTETCEYSDRLHRHYRIATAVKRTYRRKRSYFSAEENRTITENILGTLSATGPMFVKDIYHVCTGKKFKSGCRLSSKYSNMVRRLKELNKITAKQVNSRKFVYSLPIKSPKPMVELPREIDSLGNVVAQLLELDVSHKLKIELIKKVVQGDR